MKFTTVLLVSFTQSINYQDRGNDWTDGECANGFLQSPINIDKSTLKKTPKISFKLVDYHDITNATVTTPHDRSMIKIEYPNKLQSDLKVINEWSQTQTYHLDHILWHVPAEHTIDNHQYAAELQLFHSQYATNKIVAMSYLFDTDLELVGVSSKKEAKTCFVAAFEASETFQAIEKS